MAVRVAMVQMQGSASKQDNIAKAAKYIREAAANDARVVCLQELFNTTYFCYEENPAYYEWAEPIPGPTIEEIASVAKEHGVYVIAPIYEKAIPGELYNTAAVIDVTGTVVGRYRKSSIPLVKSPTLYGDEKYYFKPGNTGFQVFPTPFGINIGIMICYDRHFPEAARALALKGADIVFVPTATCGMSRYLWEIELRAHAIDNVYYVGGVNRVNKDIGGSPTQHYYGSSMFCDYRGQIISQAGDQNDEVIYADLDLAGMTNLRNEWGFFRDRRPDLYGELVK